MRSAVALTVAGSDSGGGAGIQADIKTFHLCGVHGTCAITSVTSQNTMGVVSRFDLPVEVVVSQLEAVLDDAQAARVENPQGSGRGPARGGDLFAQLCRMPAGLCQHAGCAENRLQGKPGSDIPRQAVFHPGIGERVL